MLPQKINFLRVFLLGQKCTVAIIVRHAEIEIYITRVHVSDKPWITHGTDLSQRSVLHSDKCCGLN